MHHLRLAEAACWRLQRYLAKERTMTLKGRQVKTEAKASFSLFFLFSGEKEEKKEKKQERKKIACALSSSFFFS